MDWRESLVDFRPKGSCAWRMTLPTGSGVGQRRKTEGMLPLYGKELFHENRLESESVVHLEAT